MTHSELLKSGVILNIQNMQKIIGVRILSFESLSSKSYNDLHDEQNSLINHYNQAIQNAVKTN